jgi:protein phosphatase
MHGPGFRVSHNSRSPAELFARSQTAIGYKPYMSELSQAAALSRGGELYDVIGDIHGCYDALIRLGQKLGYDKDFSHPDGRIPVFVGDLINRGPDSANVVRLVARLKREGRARSVLGNHDEAMLRYLQGKEVNLDDGGMRKTIAQFEELPDSEAFMADMRDLYEHTPLCIILDKGNLLVVHAGIEDWILARYKLPEEAEKIGTDDPKIHHFVLHGEAIGKSPEGKTLRRDWAADYHGSAFVTYGHTPQPEAEIRFHTVNLDTGAYRGGKLSALRWPEKEIVQVPSLYSSVR